MRFVFTHVCGREFGYSRIEAIRDLDNFWVETSANMEIDILRKAVEVLGPERMLFGTDWPYKPTNIEIEKLYHLGGLANRSWNLYFTRTPRSYGKGRSSTMVVTHMRIDDRLIHGQIVTAWISDSKAEEILVADDMAAKDPTQQMLLKLAVPAKIKLAIVTVEKSGRTF